MGDASGEGAAAVAAEVARRFPGVRLAPGFVAGAVPPGASTLQRRADACYAAFQNADIAESSPEGCLPTGDLGVAVTGRGGAAGAGARAAGVLRGVFVLQADETYDVGESARDRVRAVSDLGVVPSSEENGGEGEGGAGSFLGGRAEVRHVDVKGDTMRRGRTLKVVLRDGQGRRAVAVERVTCPSLSVRRPAGYKVRLTDPEVSAGVILLRPENLAVLGGKVQALEDARVQAITAANAPKYHSETGRRLRGAGGAAPGTAAPLATAAPGASEPPQGSARIVPPQTARPLPRPMPPQVAGPLPHAVPLQPAAPPPRAAAPQPVAPWPVLVQPRAVAPAPAGGGGWGVDEWDDYAEEEEEAMRLLAAAESQWEAQQRERQRGRGQDVQSSEPSVVRSDVVKEERYAETGVTDRDEEEEEMRLLAAAESHWDAQQRRREEEVRWGRQEALAPAGSRMNVVKAEADIDDEEEEALRLLEAAESQWVAKHQRQKPHAPGSAGGAIDLTAD